MKVVRLKETPPGDLLQCAVRPEGFGPDAWAIIPPAVRAKLVEIITASGLNADMVDRQVNWHVPNKCPPPDS